MRRILIISALILVVIIAGGGVWLYVQPRSLDAQKLTDDVYMFTGLGGNVDVLRTEEGAVVVDTMTFRMQGQHIQSRAEALAGGPVRAVIDTHYHADHAHGNPGFMPGTPVIATERTRHHLATKSSTYRDEAAQRFLPNTTFEREHTMTIGGKTVQLFYLGRGHTDGDLVVLFVEDRVIHLGDLFFHDFYPNIDLEAGGSVKAWAATLDRVLELEFDRVIPGHGPVADREAVRAFQRFIQELWKVGAAAAKVGLSLEETLATVNLKHDSAFGVIAIPLIMRFDRDFVIRRVWEEATGAVKPSS